MEKDEEDRKRELAKKGQQAERLLNHPLFVSTMEAMSQEALDEFKTADPGDERALMVARMRYEAANDFLNAFVHHVRTGADARGDLAVEEEKKKFAARDKLDDFVKWVDGMRGIKAEET